MRGAVGPGHLPVDAARALRHPTDDGALVEVRGDGLRHGPPEVMARLARGEPVEPDAYVFRTIVRCTTGAPAWLHLNRTVVFGVGRREPRRVVLALYRGT